MRVELGEVAEVAQLDVDQLVRVRVRVGVGVRVRVRVRVKVIASTRAVHRPAPAAATQHRGGGGRVA